MTTHTHHAARWADGALGSLGLLAALGAGAAPAAAQVLDQVLVRTLDPSTPNWDPYLLRFDRKLSMLGATPTKPFGAVGWDKTDTVAVTPRGDLWVNVPCLFPCKKALKLNRTGQPLFTVDLPATPITLACDRLGQVYVETVDLTVGGVMGPVVKLSPSGQILWSNPASSAGLIWQTPTWIVVGADQTPWIGGRHYTGVAALHTSLLHKLSPTDGSIVASYEETLSDPGFNTNFFRIQADPNGLVWLVCGAWLASQGGGGWAFRRTDGITPLDLVFQLGFGAGENARVDSKGHPGMVFSGFPELGTSSFVRFDPETGVMAEFWPLGFGVKPVAYGPTGEELFYCRTLNLPGFPRQLVKLSLVTGQMSWIDLDPTWFQSDLIEGDPTGFVLANVVDQQGDNDQDGFTNREEVLQGYNPYDPSHRPGGPKVYLSFDDAPGNPLRIRYVDPDGVLDPIGGLDLASFSVVAEHPLYGSGEIFWDLAAYLTAIGFSRDGTFVELIYGDLVLPKGLGFGLTASISDLGGASAWDWHFTPQ